tara:strand:+ start:177 stop:1388 length:1212 start_codon:yes stop_codon:yes gene_type:complete
MRGHIFLSALVAIRSSGFRTALTILIISIGVAGLIAMQSAIASIEANLTNQFVDLGANSLKIDNDIATEEGKEDAPNITLRQASQFAKHFLDLGFLTSYHQRFKPNAQLTYSSRQTDPNVSLIGGNLHYLENNGYNIEYGRNFSESESMHGSPAAILGSDAAKKLGLGNEEINNAVIVVDDIAVNVIGICASRGNSQRSNDRFVVLPASYLHQKYPEEGSYEIVVNVPDKFSPIRIEEEAIGVFRKIRGLHYASANDFRVIRSEKLYEELNTLLLSLSGATLVIGFLTILASAIALMNMLLVAVGERQREIGLKKSLGARRASILWQFLYESILLCLIGTVLGVLIGLVTGFFVAKYLEGPFVIPIPWIGISFVVTLITGLAAGLFPGIRASKLDPIVALRTE